MSEDDLRRAVPLKSKLVRAFKGKPYDEVRTREVEHGHLDPLELEEPYPYRVTKTPESFIEIRNRNGDLARHYVEWALALSEEEGYFVLAYEEDTVVKVYPDKKCTIETHCTKIELSRTSKTSGQHGDT